jgi:hypothetical protein
MALLTITRLLTTTIKVNMPVNCRIVVVKRGLKMKKIDPRRGIWDWLLGGGWCGGGAGG